MRQVRMQKRRRGSARSVRGPSAHWIASNLVHPEAPILERSLDYSPAVATILGEHVAEPDGAFVP
jgi:hypothetical protein